MPESSSLNEMKTYPCRRILLSTSGEVICAGEIFSRPGWNGNGAKNPSPTRISFQTGQKRGVFPTGEVKSVAERPRRRV